MKEKDFISVIKTSLNSDYIGDDCAYLKDLDIVVTQDSLVEDVHFLKESITPYQLGYKSIAVNLSDITSSGAKAKYLTISLSLPENVNEDFIKEFYNGAKSACPQGVEIVGGDITGSDKIYISVCAIGNCKGRRISSRKHAQPGYKVVVSGIHGSSAAGLNLILNGKNSPEKFIKAHLQPQIQTDFGEFTGKNITEDYAMMDTSDGLMDALSTIANDSGVLLEIDFDKIPYDKDIKQFENWQDLVLFGGEDYGIVAVVPKEFDCDGVCIGQAEKGSGINLKLNGTIIHYSKENVEEKIFNHWRKTDNEI